MNDSTTSGDIVPASQDDSAPVVYHFWDGNMPKAHDNVAKMFQQATILEQHHHLNVLHKLWMKEKISATEVQDLPFAGVFICHMPGSSRKVRVLHGFGVYKIDDTLPQLPMALSGDFSFDGIDPSVYCFDLDILAKVKFRVPRQSEFDEMLEFVGTSTNKSKQTLFKAKDLTKDHEYPRIVPVPPYMVYDGFTKDIDTLVLYERFLHACEDTRGDDLAPLRHALEFIRLGVVSTTAAFNNPTITHEVLQAPTTRTKASWRKDRLSKLYGTPLPPVPDSDFATPPANNNATSVTIFDPAPRQTTPTTPGDNPTVAPRPTPVSQPPSSTPAAPVPNPPQSASPSTVMGTGGHVVLTHEMFQELLNRATRDRVPPVTPSTSRSMEDDSDDDDDYDLGLSRSAFLNILGMCGLEEGMEDHLPPLWKRLGEKKIDKAEKVKIIKFAINKNVLYKSCKVPCLHSIVKMIRERNFEGDVMCDDLATAVKGLSPFCVPALSSHQVASHNLTAENIELASQTTVKDVAGNKLVCSVPTTFEGLTKHIKRFCNLVFAIFGPKSPLVLLSSALVDALEDLGTSSQAAFNFQSYASVLWILMLQARHFSSGLSEGEHTTLPVFANMLMDLDM